MFIIFLLCERCIIDTQVTKQTNGKNFWCEMYNLLERKNNEFNFVCVCVMLDGEKIEKCHREN